MSTRTAIRRLYQEEPNISSQEIIARLNIKPTCGFWKILNEEQCKIRGIYPGKRRNSNAHNRVQRRGMTYFIPPKES